MINGMIGDKRSTISSIIASAKTEEAPEIDKEVDPGLEAATDDLMSAITSNDPSAFREALKSFILMCQSDTVADESQAGESSTES